MGLSEIARTVRSMEKENRILDKEKSQAYNQEKESKAGRENDEDNLHGEERISVSGYRNAERAGNEPGSLGSKAEKLSDEAQESDVLQSVDFLRAEPPSGGNREVSAADDGNHNRTDGEAGGSDRESEGDGTDEVDRPDEQHQTGSQGSGTERPDLQLAYFDRNAEDRRLPFFNEDKVTKAIHQFSMEELFEMETLYREQEDAKERIRRLKELFAGKAQGDALYGWKLYENVLFL